MFCLPICFVHQYILSSIRFVADIVSDVKSQGQQACQEDQKRCKKEEGVNTMHDVDKMYAV
jgi:hypothetical protein